MEVSRLKTVVQRAPNSLAKRRWAPSKETTMFFDNPPTEGATVEQWKAWMAVEEVAP